jgi:hypothetical protein
MDDSETTHVGREWQERRIDYYSWQILAVLNRSRQFILSVRSTERLFPLLTFEFDRAFAGRQQAKVPSQHFRDQRANSKMAATVAFSSIVAVSALVLGSILISISFHIFPFLYRRFHI